MRGLLQPGPGEALLYADFVAQEILIAARLAGDRNLEAMYHSGDIYLSMAREAGAVTDEMPPEHVRRVRGYFKVLVLGRLYGMSFATFQWKSGLAQSQAVRIWQFFERHFARFLAWQAKQEALARRRGWVRTRYGWTARVYDSTKRGTLLNWLVQAGGADVLRAATLRLAGHGFEVLTTVHDALLVSVPDAEAECVAPQVARLMEEAALQVIGGRMRVDIQVVRSGERLLTDEMRKIWDQVMQALDGGTKEGGDVVPNVEEEHAGKRA